MSDETFVSHGYSIPGMQQGCFKRCSSGTNLVTRFTVLYRVVFIAEVHAREKHNYIHTSRTDHLFPLDDLPADISEKICMV